SRGGGKSENPAAVAGFSSGGGKVLPWDFSMKRLFPRPTYPQILLKSRFSVSPDWTTYFRSPEEIRLSNA
ncbi:MAG TPA: hypothetical protein VII95_07280, partial [Terriglobales bacterium]